MDVKRGIVLSPPFEDLPEGGFRVGNDVPDQIDWRKYLLYWDEIDYPTNNIVHLGGGPDLDFLIEAGVASRTRVNFGGSFRLENGGFFIAAQQAVFAERDAAAPGSWSLAQISNRPFFPDAQPSLAIEFELWNLLPIPESDVALADILEFKEKRRDELSSLRVYLDEMYLSIIDSKDLPRAKNVGLLKLESSLVEIERTLKESGIRTLLSSLRGFIAGEFSNITGTGLGAAGLAPLINMNPLSTGVIGAGVAFAVRLALNPPARKGSHPLTYVSSVRRSF